jgi:hypothetical protein
MKEYVVLTGASSGIGYEMAKQLAAKNINLILVARRKDQLEKLRNEIQSKYQIKVHIFQKDLSDSRNAIELYNEISDAQLKVTGLINNAGFGNYGEFSETDLHEDLEMIQVNISSLVVLSKLFLKDFKQLKQARIMNVASVLSFLPFPYYSVYSATKTFVMAFSETLGAELEGTGVTVTVLAPGPVDTGFNTKEMLRTNANTTNKPMGAVEVAKQGVELFLNGKGIKVVGFFNWFISKLPGLTPRGLMMRIKKKLASQKH